jgi:hypothetical protein
MRRSLTAALTLLVLAGCDDPAETAQQVIDARGDCSEDSLRVSSETCVRMFERYAEMVTEGIHTYIGGMKAMDRAIQRLPPANFDTVGLGRAITLPRDSAFATAAEARLPPTDRQPRPYDAPYDGSPPDAYERGPRSPVYDYPGDREPAVSELPPPAPRRGVLLPRDQRLDRPWLREDEPEEYPRRYREPYPRGYDEAYPEDYPEERYERR